RRVRENVASHTPEGAGDPQEGLGPDGRVLRFPPGALEAPADVEPGGESVRVRAAAHRKKVANATALIWRLLRVAESRFRKLNAPHLVAQVYRAVKFANGVKLNRSAQRVAA